MTRFKDAVDFTWTLLKGKPTTVATSGLTDAVATNDSRLSDARPPTAHKSTHATGGGDALAPSDIGAATATGLSNEITRATSAEGSNATTISTHTGRTDNPHSTTKVQVGLGNVVNVIQEPALSNPASDGLPLTSTAAGVRSWAQLATAAIANAAVTYAKFQNVTTGAILGRASGGVGPVEELTPAQVRVLSGLGTVALPSWNNLLGWASDPMAASSSSALTGGQIYLAKIYVPIDITITNVVEVINTAGATLTAGQNFCGVYDSAGNRLGVTADQSTSWTSAGAKAMPLTTPVNVVGGPNTFIWVATLANGTTTPTFWRATNGNTAMANIGLTNATTRAGTFGSSQNSATSNTHTVKHRRLNEYAMGWSELTH